MMRMLFRIAPLVVFVTIASAQDEPKTWQVGQVMRKIWEFRLPHGGLEVEFESDSGRLALWLGPLQEAAVPFAPISEQVGPLETVLSKAASIGLDPHKLSYVGTRTFGDEVYGALAYACVDSPEWRASMKNKGLGKEALVVKLLNRTGVYEPYNKVFALYGLRARVTEAEDVWLGPFSHYPPRSPADRALGSMKVPVNAALGMRFSPLEPRK